MYNGIQVIYERNRGKIRTVADVANDEKIREVFGTSSYGENAEFSEMIFEGKNAVVPLAMCRVGKTTWCRAFCKEHPDFEYIAYDEVGEETSAQYPDYDNGSLNTLNDLKIMAFLENAKGNVVIDGYFMECEFRAALLQVLRRLGFKIHIVFFTLNYTLKYFYPHAARRAVKEILYEREVKKYVEQWKKEGRWQELRAIYHNIMQITSEKLGKSEDEVYQMMMQDKDVEHLVNRYMNIHNSHMHRYNVYSQELHGITMLGCDYFYTVKEEE